MLLEVFDIAEQEISASKHRCDFVFDSLELTFGGLARIVLGFVEHAVERTLTTVDENLSLGFGTGNDLCCFDLGFTNRCVSRALCEQHGATDAVGRFIIRGPGWSDGWLGRNFLESSGGSASASLHCGSMLLHCLERHRKLRKIRANLFGVAALLDDPERGAGNGIGA